MATGSQVVATCIVISQLNRHVVESLVSRGIPAVGISVRKSHHFSYFFSLSILRLWSCCLFSLATQSAVNKQITVHLSGSHVTTLLYVSK